MSPSATTQRPHHADPPGPPGQAAPARDDRPAGADERQAQAEEFLPTDLPRVGIGAVLLFTAAFVALLAGLFVLGFRPHQEKHARTRQATATLAEAKPVVSVTRPRPPQASTELKLPANVEAFQQTAIYPRASGYLRRLHVDIGDAVQADELLAELDTPEIDAQLSQARATAQQAEANLDKAQVDLKLAESTLGRYDDVQQSGAVAQQELDEKRTQVEQARAGVGVARANVEAARAQIQQLQTLKDFARITAPFAGVVTARHYDVGALLSPNNAGGAKPLFTMEQVDTLRVFVNVPQSASTAIQTGAQAELQVNNYPGRAFQGKIVRSAGSIDPTTRTLRVEIHVPNRDRALYAGMYGQVILPLEKSSDVWVVPTSALVYNADGLSLAVAQDSMVCFRPVKVGRDFGKEIEVVEGLAGEELVITNPGEHLREGLVVQVVAATQPAGQAGRGR